MSLRRFTRLTNAFSKKWCNLENMLAVFFAFYNFVRPHQFLNKFTPAIAHGISEKAWTIEDLLNY
jgi:transposase InsO family protein